MAVTPKNIIDNTSTTVSAATPGPTLDLRYHTTVSRTALGVPVRLWAFASSTEAADGGEITAKDSSGTELLTVPITGTTAAWYYTDGYLPATLAKYDFHFGNNTDGTLTPYALMLEPVVEPTAPVPPLIAFMGQSNAGDNTDFEQGDNGLDLGSTYPNVYITSKYGISDPITWNVNRSRETLRPSAAGGGANMGATLAAGRLLYQRAGVTEIVQFAVSGSKISKWLPGSGYPTSPGGSDDLFTQSVAYIRAAEAASGTALAAIVWIQGEQDATDSADSLAYEARLGTLFAAYRAEFGEVPVIISGLNSSAVATYLSNVRAAQVAYVASDANSALVSVDDLPMIDSFHYGPKEICTIGTRNASKALDMLAYPAQEVVTASPIFIGAEPGMSGTGALTPRSRPDLVDGDVEVLITSANYAAAADSLTTAAGFTLAEEGASVWTAVNSNGRMYTRTVTTATLNANGGIMPSPVVADSNDKNAAKIYAFRGPSGSITIGDTAFSVNNTADTPISCPSVTTTTADNLVVSFLTGWGGSGTNNITSTANAGLTGVAEVQDSVFNVSTEGILIGAISGVKATAGATGATTGTLAAYAVQTNFTIALAP